RCSTVSWPSCGGSRTQGSDWPAAVSVSMPVSVSVLVSVFVRVPVPVPMTAAASMRALLTTRHPIRDLGPDARGRGATRFHVAECLSFPYLAVFWTPSHPSLEWDADAHARSRTAPSVSARAGVRAGGGARLPASSDLRPDRPPAPDRAAALARRPASAQRSGPRPAGSPARPGGRAPRAPAGGGGGGRGGGGGGQE